MTIIKFPTSGKADDVNASVLQKKYSRKKNFNVGFQEKKILRKNNFQTLQNCVRIKFFKIK